MFNGSLNELFIIGNKFNLKLVAVAGVAADIRVQQISLNHRHCHDHHEMNITNFMKVFCIVRTRSAYK